jgi:hypothetical protein
MNIEKKEVSMNNKKKNVSLPELILKPIVGSIFFIGRERMKKQKGFIDLRLLILIAVLILILLMVLL